MHQTYLKMRLKRAEEGTSLWLLKKLLEQASDFENCDDPALLKKRLWKLRLLAEDLASVFPDLQYVQSLRRAPGRAKVTEAAKEVIADLYLRGEIIFGDEEGKD